MAAIALRGRKEVAGAALRWALARNPSLIPEFQDFLGSGFRLGPH